MTPNGIQFMIQPDSKVVLRISRDSIWADPDVDINETAKLVLQAMGHMLTKRHWVGLADEEIADLLESTDYYNFPEDLIINTQTKLRDINT